MSLRIQVSREPVQPPFEALARETWWRWEVSERRRVRVVGWSQGCRIAAFRAARAAVARLELLKKGAPPHAFALNSEQA